MKICIIASLYDPYVRGGAEVIAESITRQLAKDNDVCVITTDERRGIHSFSPRVEYRQGIRVYRFYPMNLFSFIHINTKPFLLRLLWNAIDFLNVHSIVTVWRIIRKERPDIIMVHTLKGLSYGIAPLLNAMRVKWVYTPHDVQLLIPTGRLYVGRETVLENPLLRFYRMIVSFLFGSPPLVAFSSSFLSNIHARNGFFSKSKMIIMPTPIPRHLGIRLERVNEQCVRFMYLGQLEEAKGVRDLLRAFQGYPDQTIRLSIVGAGPLEHDVRAACQSDSRITYHGYLSENDKHSALAKSDYLVVCSKICENCPTVICEALSLGVPVIAVAAGGAAELIEDGVNGYVLLASDEGVLKTALLKAAANPSYDTMAAQAKMSGAKLSIDRYCAALLRCFSERQ